MRCFAALHESGIGPKRRSRNVCSHAAVGGKADVSPSTITKLDVIRERWRPGRPCFERVLGSFAGRGFAAQMRALKDDAALFHGVINDV